jgi:hypothetical protein
MSKLVLASLCCLRVRCAPSRLRCISDEVGIDKNVAQA